MDYDMTLECRKMSPEDVLERFNDAITSVEREAEYKASFDVEMYGEPSFSEKRALEFVECYDDFINASNFKLGVYYVSKLQMENFWRFIGQKNSYSIGNKVKTYGGTSVYEVKYGKNVLGYLKNNMTFDGQNSHFLFSNNCKKVGEHELCVKKTVEKLFLSNKKYPASVNAIGGKLTRWGKIVAELEANGATAINAWSVLKSEDSRFFYWEMKQHNWLTEGDKQLLKAIRKMRQPMSFEMYKDEVESRIDEIKNSIAFLEENVANNEELLEKAYVELLLEGLAESKRTLALKNDIQNSNIEIMDLEAELEELEDKVISFNEEDNSMSSDSELEAYDNWNYYMEGGY